VWSNHPGFNNGEGVPEEMSTVVGSLPYDPHNFGGFTSDRDHNFGQDREAMKNGHFSGFVGNLLQEDTVTQASMGPIVDRTKDHLSSSDVAIIHTQRILLEGIGDVAAGRTPRGARPGMDHRDVVPVNVLRPAKTDDSSQIVDYYASAK
jgi:phthalate 4,5-dioxygenase